MTYILFSLLQNQASSIVEEIFPANEADNEADSSLDRLVVAMSADLIDDFPASDPRWLRTVPGAEAGSGIGSTMSLLILHQLEDKQTALEVYINFLKEVGLWKRLTGVSTKELVTATTLVLSEHVEKTAATITLRTVHAQHQSVIDEAIRETLKMRSKNQASDLHDHKESLTPQDFFYREISRVDEIINGFQCISERATSGFSPREVVSAVYSMNAVMLTVLKEVTRVRASKKQEFYDKRFEYLPWTSSPGPQGIRTLLMRQFHLTLTKVLPLVEDLAKKEEFYGQCTELADFVLDGYKCQLESVWNQERQKSILKMYEKDRGDLIMALIGKLLFFLQFESRV